MIRKITLFLAVAVLFGAPVAAEVCEGIDSDRYFGDTDCDGIKDGGEEYYDLASGAPSADSIGTTELDDGADTPSTGHLVAVDSASTALFEYLALADEFVSDGDTLSVDHDATTNFVADEHVAHSGVTLTAGAGLGGGGDISANRSFNTDSTEADFLASGALTCGASTQGKVQVHTTPLQYCDNQGTPTLQYAAYGASDGDALAGDSATGFFDAGEVEDARIVDALTVSAGTINLENSTMTGILDDEFFVGTGGGTGAYAALQNCTDGVAYADWNGASFDCVTIDDDEGQAIKQDAGDISATDDAIAVRYILRNSTTNATPTEIFLDGSSTRMGVSSDESWSYECLLVARRTDADNESAVYKVQGAIDNNAGTTALVGSSIKEIIHEDTAAWQAAVTADDTNDALVITVTGEAAKTINWVAQCDTTQVAG